MSTSKLQRAAAVAAFATAASSLTVGLAATSSASAAPAAAVQRAPRIDTHLTAAAPAKVDLDGAAVVRGRLTARGVPLPDRKVRLLVKRDGAQRWTLGRIDRTNRNGVARFGVSPAVEVSYRLVFFGSSRYQPDRSRVVSVAPRSTKVSIAATPRVVEPGSPTVIDGVVTDEDVAVAGATVELRARKAGTRRAFEPVAYATSDATGKVSFTTTPLRSTAYVLLARPTASSDLARSAVTTVSYKAATRIAVRGRKVAGTYSVVGVLRSGGKGFGHRTVTLESQAPGATIWTAVRTKKTARDGYVDFRRPFVDGTSYRIVFAGAPRYAASTSRTVVA